MCVRRSGSATCTWSAGGKLLLEYQNDALTGEALEAVLSLFGQAKNKAAFRERAKELAQKMLEAGLTIWEDLRGVDLDWLEFKVGVPHFEALAFFRCLDESAFETLEQAPGV